MTKDKAFRF